MTELGFTSGVTVTCLCRDSCFHPHQRSRAPTQQAANPLGRMAIPAVQPHSSGNGYLSCTRTSQTQLQHLCLEQPHKHFLQAEKCRNVSRTTLCHREKLRAWPDNLRQAMGHFRVWQLKQKQRRLLAIFLWKTHPEITLSPTGAPWRSVLTTQLPSMEGRVQSDVTVQ